MTEIFSKLNPAKIKIKQKLSFNFSELKWNFGIKIKQKFTEQFNFSELIKSFELNSPN